MVTSAVQLDLEPEAALVFQKAGADVRKRIAALLSALITQQAKNPRSLTDVMNALADETAARGLTEEKLNALLDEA